jgi:Ca2+-binding RTX toxin-like protein
LADVIGTTGDDSLAGTAGTDSITGLAGNDTIDGGPGNDILVGGGGADTFFLRLGDGRDSVFGSSDADDLLRVLVPLEDIGHVRDELGPDLDAWRYVYLTDGTQLTEFRRSVQSLDLLQADDTGVLAVRPGSRGTVVGTDAAEVFASASGNARIEGHGGNDIIFANLGRDVALGGSGDDYIASGLDDASDDWLDGEDGIDTLSYTGAGSVTIDIGRSYAMGATIGYDRVFNFEAAIGSGGDDVLIGRDGAGDTLKGYWGNDCLYAGAADDVLSGGHGSDVLLGEADDDTMDGGEGADWLYGGSGLNKLSGGGGVDVLISQGANDTLDGGEGDDYLYGQGTGEVRAHGGSGNDIFVMTQAGIADGGEGQDYFYMSGASDMMLGGAGVDVLLGGGGNDRFDGGTGTDYLFLGEGSSLVVFRADSGADVVHDFKAVGSTHVIRFEGTRFANAADVLAATYDHQGDALIRLDSDTVVWLVGTAKAQLAAGDFQFG